MNAVFKEIIRKGQPFDDSVIYEDPAVGLLVHGCREQPPVIRDIDQVLLTSVANGF